MEKVIESQKFFIFRKPEGWFYTWSFKSSLYSAPARVYGPFLDKAEAEDDIENRRAVFGF